MPYRDPELERLYLYGRHPLGRLPRRADGGVDMGEVGLSHLRVEKTGEYDVSLGSEGPAEPAGFGDGAGAAKDTGKSALSELIDRFNSRFGTDFTEEDVLPAFRATLKTYDRGTPAAAGRRRATGSPPWATGCSP